MRFSRRPLRIRIIRYSESSEIPGKARIHTGRKKQLSNTTAVFLPDFTYTFQGFSRVPEEKNGKKAIRRECIFDAGDNLEKMVGGITMWPNKQQEKLLAFAVEFLKESDNN